LAPQVLAVMLTWVLPLQPPQLAAVAVPALVREGLWQQAAAGTAGKGG